MLAWFLRRSGVRLQTVRRDAYDQAFLTELFDLSRTVIGEQWDGFRTHAETTALVHVFRDVKDGSAIGFQFWRVVPLQLPRSQAILGGKLRVKPEFRRRSLHILSALLFYLHCKARHPTTRFYRLSLAALFGFVSVTGALAWFRFFDEDDRSEEGQALSAAFAAFAADNGFRIEPKGLVHTGVGVAEATLAQFGPAYFEREATRAYVARNPDFRTNCCSVAFWFRFDRRNIISMLRTVWRKSRA
ncbi:hypothetical protein [Roseiterribacter gracilis]|uniref:Uncharacterized protein n=1 Tax=Roseiterribacter gracilis TaxID=2812848 RepID=A0A8S8X8U6_9PROT|nr:hypothetical protein TMPK1_01860 [Rhodospirillales bacterium TMPK1]